MSKSTRIFIKRPGNSDIQPATEFAFKMIKEVYGRGIDPVWDSDLLNFEEFYLHTRGNTFLVAFNENGEIAGTLAVRRYDGRIKVLEGFYDLKATAELAKCYVDRKYRRRGIGSLLVKEAEQFCRGAGYKVIYLYTHMYLPGGYEFWHAQGFKLRLYEGGSQQTVHMEKILLP
ncbi:GNAT family N-acetyltransferase [Desulfofundulus thermosubterraneus]|uniref:Acetyltransferase (GNAT) family protein n=1 Tax=Desulfofundulus thermosubterraneus DSM 16057 TaxID=1121432 RepID=A0A1M6LIM1_9FIRM|nr:GNAT family N-acetyltransferase [Desulfofundulus thermosubterraneus]SHJ71040.1 Acetyltransferase (GNAT) family protein [Desulfofundulus thermosubterraneus DSM 16057]